MKVTQVNENCIQITKFGLMKCYLVRESDGFTLIDTGLPGEEKTVLAAAEAAGVPIRRILLTHAHQDHMGSVDAVVTALGAQNLTLAASERSLPLLRKPADRSLRPGEVQKPIKGGTPGVDAKVSHVVSGGELFGSLRAIETPGHIPGHLSFLDERDGTLYAGDALVTVGGLSVSGFAPWYFPLPNIFTWDKATALASARHIAEYPIARFAAGHGPVRTGGAAMLRAVIAKESAE